MSTVVPAAASERAIASPMPEVAPLRPPRTPDQLIAARLPGATTYTNPKTEDPEAVATQLHLAISEPTT
ncbi:hypothetical protein [Actinomadura miaoliensis]|uniref:Uncharacterized protein n=1 Tax=Actinomadura miaoliensis TaxID=430685 RepID=A0ABP7WI54_9ACTN